MVMDSRTRSTRTRNDANFNEWEDEDDAEAARAKFAGHFAPLLLIEGHHYDVLVYP